MLCILAFVAMENMDVHEMNVKTMFFLRNARKRNLHGKT
jgi:hypothetical protein